MPKNTVHIQLSTKNDTNGNPRRLSVLVCPTDGILHIANHGYYGKPLAWGTPALSINIGVTTFTMLDRPTAIAGAKYSTASEIDNPTPWAKDHLIVRHVSD